MGPCKTLFMDEISTGLDSSTTYQIVRCIRNMVHLRKVWPIFLGLSVTDAVASDATHWVLSSRPGAPLILKSFCHVLAEHGVHEPAAAAAGDLQPL